MVLFLWSVSAHGAQSPSVAPTDFPYALFPAKDIALSAMGVTLSVGGLIWSQSINDLSEHQIDALNSSDVNAFDRSATRRWSSGAATASDVFVVTAALLPLIPVIHQFAVHRKKRATTLLLMYAEAFTISLGFTSVVKAFAKRNRPFLYNDDLSLAKRASLPDPAISFFSAHTSLAFCGATFLSTTFSAMAPNSRWRIVIWSASLSLASTIGVLRYVAGKHFPSDILTGAAFGALVGVFVPWLHRNPAQEVVVYPVGGRINGIGASVRF
ncbi:MAG: phosphatase PAP2 family protein [Deltaproteobacteria bacterium]|nr:phosphatase PAP2 family protein [Deltaproteobacteria bacterium]